MFRIAWFRKDGSFSEEIFYKVRDARLRAHELQLFGNSVTLWQDDSLFRTEYIPFSGTKRSQK